MATVIASKRKKGTVKLIVGALAFGLAAAGFTYLYLRMKENELLAAMRAREGRQVAVVVAKRDLPQGSPINGATMAVRQIPAELAYPDVVTPDLFARYEGNFLTKPLGSGTPLLKTFVQEELARDFSDTIALGRRAMTLQVDEINSIAGFIRPGNRIDLYARLPAETKGSQRSDDQDRIVPLLQNIEVLATGREAAGDYQAKYIEVSGGNRNAFTYTTLTVNVSPEQAALLAAAREKGDLVALLRNRKDTGRALFEEIKPQDIYGYAQREAEGARVHAASADLDNVRALNDGDLIVKDGVVMTRDGKVLQDLIVQPDGTVTTRDGRVVMSRDGKLADGVILTPDGKVIVDPNLVVKNGVVMTKEGVVLSGRGLRVNEHGQLVTDDGSVVDPGRLQMTKEGKLLIADGRVLNDTDTVVSGDGRALKPGDVQVTKDGFLVTRDGTVMTRDGTVLKGVKVDAEGRVVAADGTVLTPDGISVGADGSVTRRVEQPVAGVRAEKGMSAGEVARQLAAGQLTETKDGFLVAADGTVMTRDGTVLRGATVNANGEVVTADGTVLKASQLAFGPDGQVRSVTQQAVAGVAAQPGNAQAVAMGKLIADGLTEREDGLLVAADGTVMTKDGTLLRGVTVGADGQLRTADGRVLDGNDLVVQADGTVVTRDGKRIRGVTADTGSAQARLMREVLQARSEAQAAALAATFELIIGGSSRDGVPTVTAVQVQK